MLALQTLLLPADTPTQSSFLILTHTEKVVGGVGNRAVHNRAAACFAAGGGIYENQLYA